MLRNIDSQLLYQETKRSGLVNIQSVLRCDLKPDVESELKYAKEQCHDIGNGEEFGSCKAQK